MAKIRKSTAKSTSFKRDVVVLASGTIVGQALTILAAPVISRLFLPEAFGVFALVTSITTVFVSISTLAYESAIILPKRDGDAANLMAGTLGINLIFCTALIPLMWLIGPSISVWLRAPELISYLWLIPFLVFFGGFGAGHLVLNAWAARTRRFVQITTTKIWGMVATNIGKVAAGLAGFTSAGGLIAGSAMGSILTPVMLGVHIWKEDAHLLSKGISFAKLRRNLSRYRKFAIYNTPSSMLNNLSLQAPAFLLAAFFSPTVVGFYAFGNQIIRNAMYLIGTSISRAFYPHATAANRQKELAPFVESTFRRLIEYSLFPILILALTGRELFSVFFGARWAQAGVYSQVLSIWMFAWLMSEPVSELIKVLEKNEFYFKWSAATLVTRVVSIAAGGFLGSPLLALTLFSLSGTCIYAYISYWVSVKAGVPWRRIVSRLLRNLAIFAPAGILIALLKLLHLPDFAIASLAIAFTGAYFLYRAKNEPTFLSLFARARELFTK